MALRAVSAAFDEVSDFGEAVWRADALARHACPAGVVATGHALLDAELPGGGWPVGGLCEILQSHSAQSEWRLLLPALCAAQQPVVRPGAASWVVLIGPPLVPFGPALAALGLDVGRLLWVKAQAPAERLWAAEQALRCAGVAAVLAWLPQVQTAPLRRLQMAALTHAKLLFVMRPASAQHESSPALLRLLLGQGASAALTRAGAMGQSAVAACGTRVDPDALLIQVLKRRGPPLAQTLVLPAPWPGLSALLAACDAHDTGARKLGPRQIKAALALSVVQERQHALDGLAA